MIAANIATSQFLEAHHFPVLHRVVYRPKNWARIRVLAKEYQKSLPKEPDAKALEKFLTEQRVSDPLRFPA